MRVEEPKIPKDGNRLEGGTEARRWAIDDCTDWSHVLAASAVRGREGCARPQQMTIMTLTEREANKSWGLETRASGSPVAGLQLDK